MTAVGEIVKGSGGQIGSDLVVSERVGPTEDSRRFDLSVHQLEMPVFLGFKPGRVDLPCGALLLRQQVVVAGEDGGGGYQS